MIYYILVGLSSAIFFFLTKKNAAKPFFSFCTKTLNLLNTIIDKDLNEEDKHSLMVVRLKHLLAIMGKLILFILAITFLSFLPILIYKYIYSVNTIDLYSYKFFLATAVGSLTLFIPNKNKNSDYSFWSKLLHTLVLDNYNVGKFLFRKSVKKSKQENTNAQEPFLVVSGLARAGTTALTKMLYKTENFHSFSYANMPFLMAPKLWKRVYNPKKGNLKERAHGDKVLFGHQSIEALDEYFFKLWLNDSFIHENSLNLHEIDEKVYAKYMQYQNFVKQKNEPSIYITKNNNFVLRYSSMRKFNPNFLMIIMFRNPLTHAYSLWNQDNNFLKQQSEDPFVLQYMNWLGHYEFGQNQKAFDFGYSDNWNNYSKDSLNYWLAIWINYYSFILEKIEIDSQKTLLISYQDFLNFPDKVLAHINSVSPWDLNPIQVAKFNKKDPEIQEVDKGLLKTANVLYEQLIKAKIHI